MTDGPVRTHGPPAVLSIAGLDPSGGAGILADKRVYTAYGLYGTGVVTALTVQDTRGVASIQPVDAAVIKSQLRTLTDDIRPAASKTAMLATGELAETVAAFAREGQLGRLVVDPVLMSTSGSPLGGKDLLKALREALIPVCDLVTPNIPEAEILTGLTIDDTDSALSACDALVQMGADSACVTGGHWPGEPVDVYLDPSGPRLLEVARAEQPSGSRLEIHGSGCCFSAAVVARMALGDSTSDAVSAAKAYTTQAIAAGVTPGHGMSVPWSLLPFESGSDRV